MRSYSIVTPRTREDAAKSCARGLSQLQPGYMSKLMYSNHRADYRAMINSARWVELRAQVLSVRPLCARCMHEGRETLATEVHHISPVEDGATAEDRRRLMFDATNLQPLCHSCHVAVHVELGRGGKRGTARRVETERKAIDRLFTGEDDGTRIQRPVTRVKKTDRD